jgi:hypothetical protein
MNPSKKQPTGSSRSPQQQKQSGEPDQQSESSQRHGTGVGKKPEARRPPARNNGQPGTPGAGRD